MMLKLYITQEIYLTIFFFIASAVMDDKVVGSCLHTVSAVDGSQEG